MLKPTVKAEKFEKYGFRKCRGEYGKHGCYYLCVARGAKMIFVSDVCFGVNDWKDSDQRIHSKANCKYSDKRTYLDIIFLLIRDGMLTSDAADGAAGEVI